MITNQFYNFIRGIFFHIFLATISFGTVISADDLNVIFGWKGISPLSSILYYLMIAVATQFPNLLFLNAGLSRESVLQRWPVGRLQFYLRCFVFWAMLLFVFYAQLGLDDGNVLSKGIARWIFLLGLAMFFSTFDYAIPSYKRYVRLLEAGNWGARARVFSA